MELLQTSRLDCDMKNKESIPNILVNLLSHSVSFCSKTSSGSVFTQDTTLVVSLRWSHSRGFLASTISIFLMRSCTSLRGGLNEVAKGVNVYDKYTFDSRSAFLDCLNIK
ncbi:hypothetical protein PSHT_13308 [Puccinia striiformis]|uniref:Uncharacterized protein n=1 Tax=Puccinia striiformis TaxID=27350 RepID=A0A2S4URU0_9BASI|nr:hypothetical protein PSHT_13308 [Puccinia striiformis]